MRRRRRRHPASRLAPDLAHVGNGHDKSATGFEIRRQLRYNFIGEVPGQQQYGLRLVREDSLRRHDGNVAAWRQPALLQRVAVGDVVEIVGAETEKAEQRTALGRRTIADDASTSRTHVANERDEIGFDLADVLAHAQIGLPFVQPAFALLIEQAPRRARR